ncbi:serine/threonine-protein kinase [Cellulomonas shaoxiangyii]|uniref:serine/threonine-protein kinase n=1 Tax=Cellulomonas shaoxiangyii TaxID=2566013 RepID=UPI001408DE17|nr:serine/threonine-protein kinase [Cellulomonas shaoxiangyii]
MPVVLGHRYRLQEVIGRGGSGTVHRAQDELLGREVAVKVLPAVPRGSDELARHEAEIAVLARLRHHGLVRLFDADSVPYGGDLVQAYLVMEIVRGPSLAERFRDGPLTVRQTAAVGRAAADALAVVHAQGIVHRDIKPGNVLLVDAHCLDEPDDVHEWLPARLVDFGIARLSAATRLTQTGTVLGTVAYLSPEQALGGEIGAPADVYSLGLVLLEAVTGRRAFTGTTAEVAAARVMRDPDVPADLDPRLHALLQAMTTRRAEDRPAAADVAHELLDLLEGVPWEEPTRAFPAAAAPAPGSAGGDGAAQHGPAPASATDDAPTVPAPAVVPVAEPGAARTPAELRAAEALAEWEATTTASADAPGGAPTGPSGATGTGSAGPVTPLPGTVGPDRRPHGRHRAAVAVAAVLTLAATGAAMQGVRGSGAPPDAPADYPAVDGALGDALTRLQRSVTP